MKRLSSEGAGRGLLAIALALSAALVTTAWLGHRGATQAAEHLVRTRANSLAESMQSQLTSSNLATSADRPSPAQWTTIFGQHQDQGLLYAGLFDSQGTALLRAGEEVLATAAGNPIARLEAANGWTRSGEAFGVLLPWNTPSGGHSDLSLILHLESKTARDLPRESSFILALAIAAALLFTTAAVALWGQTRKQERGQRQLEKQQRLNASGVMSAVLAHEIRNPLASLKGHSQLLAEQVPEDHPAGGKVRRIVSEATRLERLTTDLLTFARSGALDRQLTDPVILVEDCKREIGSEQIRIDSRSAPALWSLDGPRFHQVLSNLLRNALQASPPDAPVEASISVVASPRGSELVVTIRDHGKGLPEGQEEEIFEPFFTTRTRGTGLGLAVARRIVESHGGSLAGSNHPEGGAELVARVPGAPAP
ncbi:MAG: hypothetical protein K0U98_11950 [Deltaproteobacteria bacterium]|nr:hypothetical protein [Deltaproteobacteria bacterium]